MAKGTCPVVDDTEPCGRPARCQGMCTMHYQRWRKLHAPVCIIDGCNLKQAAHGWCGTHYARWRKRGTTDEPPPRHYNQGKIPGNFKGAAVGYDALHDWVRRHKGKPGPTCEQCGHDGSEHRLEWANKSHEYLRDLDDWLPLCCICHRRYDREHDGPTVRERFPEIAGQIARRRERTKR